MTEKTGQARAKADELKACAEDESTSMTRAEALAEIAGEFGDRAFSNYSQVRSLAVNLRDHLRDYLCKEEESVYLVPPSGKFSAQDYGSGAYSVSGQGFLPLEPLSFGLAVRVSGKKDYLRIVMTVRKEGEVIFLTPDHGKAHKLTLPVSEDQYSEVVEALYEYLIDWFASRIDRYDNGNYGNNDIGFDIIRAAE